MSKGLKIFIAVSVLLNVLLLGIVIGTFSHTFVGRMEKGKRALMFLKDLPPEKRDMVIETMKDMKKESRETRKKIKQKKNEVIDVFSAPEFDSKLFDRKVAEMHALMGEVTAGIADETKKIAAELNHEERKAIADIIRRGPGPPFPRFLMEGFHGPDGPPPPPPPPHPGMEDWHDGPGGEPHE
jgi:uncharacterized membrane protein